MTQDELDKGLDLGVSHRTPEGARGEGLYEIANLGLLACAASIKRGVTWRWPVLDDGFQSEAVDAQVGAWVAVAVEDFGKLNGPAFVSFLVGFFVRTWGEIVREMFFDKFFGAKGSGGRAIFPSDPRSPGFVDPGGVSEGVLFTIGWDGPEGERGRGDTSDAALFGVCDVEAELEGIFFVEREDFRPGVVGVVGRGGDGQAVFGGGADTAPEVEGREAAVSFVADGEHFKVGVEFAGSGFDEVFTIASAFVEVTGDGAGFDVGFWLEMSGFSECFLHRAEGEFEEEVGHDQLVTNVEETILGFVFGEEAKGIMTSTFDASVSIVVSQSRARGIGPVVGSVEMKEIAQGVAEFVAVQTTQHRLSAGAAGFLVGGVEFSAQEFHDRFDVVRLRLRCLAGRHFA